MTNVTNIVVDNSECCHTETDDPVIYICCDCHEVLRSCPDPGCVGIFHHQDEGSGRCSYDATNAIRITIRLQK